MQWSDVVAAHLTPSGPIAPAPPVPRSTARRLRDAVEPIATIGWWARAAGDEFELLGLDFFGGYVWGLRGRGEGRGAGRGPAVRGAGGARLSRAPSRPASKTPNADATVLSG